MDSKKLTKGILTDAQLREAVNFGKLSQEEQQSLVVCFLVGPVYEWEAGYGLHGVEGIRIIGGAFSELPIEAEQLKLLAVVVPTLWGKVQKEAIECGYIMQSEITQKGVEYIQELGLSVSQHKQLAQTVLRKVLNARILNPKDKYRTNKKILLLGKLIRAAAPIDLSELDEGIGWKHAQPLNHALEATGLVTVDYQTNQARIKDGFEHLFFEPG